MGDKAIKDLTNPDALGTTNLEHTEMKISLSFWATGSARVVFGRCYSFERVRARRVEHFECEVVPVDDNGKVVPRGSQERGAE